MAVVDHHFGEAPLDNSTTDVSFPYSASPRRYRKTASEPNGQSARTFSLLARPTAESRRPTEPSNHERVV
jgi:hypothetical protein